jgi:hypothetical protein
MQEVTRVALQDIFYLHDIVTYVVTKIAKQPLNRSQSCNLICEGRAVLDGDLSYKSYSIVDPGIHLLEVYGRSYTINVVPIALETS